VSCGLHREHGTRWRTLLGHGLGRQSGSRVERSRTPILHPFWTVSGDPAWPSFICFLMGRCHCQRLWPRGYYYLRSCGLWGVTDKGAYLPLVTVANANPTHLPSRRSQFTARSAVASKGAVERIVRGYHLAGSRNPFNWRRVLHPSAIGLRRSGQEGQSLTRITISGPRTCDLNPLWPFLGLLR
jgi:hypothetical protein